MRSETQWLLCSLFGIVAGAAAPILYYAHFATRQRAFAEVVPGRVYRCAKPSPEELQSWIEAYDIRTVITLCLRDFDTGRRIAEIVRRNGVRHAIIGLSVYRIPKPGQLAALADALEEAHCPVLIHCRRGIDRSGFVSALAAMAIGGASYEEAVIHAYVPPGPWKRQRRNGFVHISDTFTLYERYCRERGIDTGGWPHFLAWIDALCENHND